MNKLRFLMLLLAFPYFCSDAQSNQGLPPTDELYKTVASLDAALFDAYNKCDVAKFKAYLADDLEFYHDQFPAPLGKESLTEVLRTSICGKERRELVPGTLQAHPMTGYGALVMGIHRFYPVAPTGAAPVVEEKFIELWQYKDAGWKIARVIDYDHHTVAN